MTLYLSGCLSWPSWPWVDQARKRKLGAEMTEHWPFREGTRWGARVPSGAAWHLVWLALRAEALGPWGCSRASAAGLASGPVPGQG